MATPDWQQVFKLAFDSSTNEIRIESIGAASGNNNNLDAAQKIKKALDATKTKIRTVE